MQLMGIAPLHPPYALWIRRLQFSNNQEKEVFETVIASAAKQSILRRKERMDYFVAPLLALTALYFKRVHGLAVRCAPISR
jgi:hypothetical protein